jgi:hypothetical protein
MKQLKALEILKQIAANNLPTFDTTQKFVTYVNEVNKAIIELQALQKRITEFQSHISYMEKQFEDYEEQLKLKSKVILEIKKLESPKNCEGCKWFTLKGRTCSQIEDSIYPNYHILDDSGFYINNYEIEDKNFYCSRYEPKDSHEQ